MPDGAHFRCDRRLKGDFPVELTPGGTRPTSSRSFGITFHSVPLNLIAVSIQIEVLERLRFLPHLRRDLRHRVRPSDVDASRVPRWWWFSNERPTPRPHTEGRYVATMSIEVRQATAEDWPAVRAVRLRALADAPGAFASRLEDERDRPESAWRDRLAIPARALSWRTTDVTWLASSRSS